MHVGDGGRAGVTSAGTGGQRGKGSVGAETLMPVARQVTMDTPGWGRGSEQALSVRVQGVAEEEVSQNENEKLQPYVHHLHSFPGRTL